MIVGERERERERGVVSREKPSALCAMFFQQLFFGAWLPQPVVGRDGVIQRRELWPKVVGQVSTCQRFHPTNLHSEQQ